MTNLATYETDVSDMYAVHKALLGALDAAPECLAKAGLRPERVEVTGSFYENVIEFLHVHHSSEDEVLYPLLEERCVEVRSVLEQPSWPPPFSIWLIGKFGERSSGQASSRVGWRREGRSERRRSAGGE